MELHVFDFDGTIFYSPKPSARLKKIHGGNVYAKLMRPLQDNGLGWFQSLSTLSPPAVPKSPSIEEWYVTPVLQRLKELKQRQSDALATGASECVKIFVLTGRDEKFRSRIDELLTHAGLGDMMSAVFMKPHETYGTVKFKLETFYTLIARNRPDHVYYYEDREEQGQQILDGIRMLSHAVHPNTPESFYVYFVILEESGAVRPFPQEEKTERKPCGPALRWWEEIKRRASPDPLSSISPFTFTVLLVDPILSARSECSLTTSAEDNLLSQLRYEREAYEFSSPREEKKKVYSFGHPRRGK
ncbi:hypothetical protein MOQ_009410 [Trypanosoma cruzi marinkellei]|uniref:Swiss Army Knife RNA repair protein HAD domain-containing protein n=1 Tax=Trypanosoma cruzi marinkellei TaxID=85056 RepID=K2MMI2_TRYCR|nr:hypothetical protein MOQ_009410 [Trypanosoma cruzi marinkellei]